MYATMSMKLYENNNTKHFIFLFDRTPENLLEIFSTNPNK